MSPDAAIGRLEAASTLHLTACGDGRMHWRAWGDGPTTVVLLHGGFGSWLHWIRNVEPLAARFRVLAADLPGLGDSDHPGEPVTPERLGAIVAAGLDEILGPRAAVHLAGFSFGGLVAGQVALALGDRAASLTLAGASGLGLPRPRFELRRRRDDMGGAEREEALRYNLRALMVCRDESVDALALEVHARNDARARLKSRRMSLGDSLRRALERSNVPVVGIWGEHDATVGEHVASRRDLLAALRPGAPFHVVEGAGHWVQYEAAGAFDDLLATAVVTRMGSSPARNGR